MNEDETVNLEHEYLCSSSDQITSKTNILEIDYKSNDDISIKSDFIISYFTCKLNEISLNLNLLKKN